MTIYCWSMVTKDLSLSCQLEALTMLMDDAIAKIEAENRKNPLYICRIQKAKLLLNFQPENSQLNSKP